LLLPNGKASEDSDEVLQELTFEQLKQMPKHSVDVCFACAGNRRKFLMGEHPTIKGLQWTIGGLSNARFTGVPVRHLILEVMGLKEEELKGKHLVAVSLDADFAGKHYEVSVPIERALDPRNEMILAYEQNGEAIPVMHGYPVRLICPGYIAVRSAKWVSKLIINDEEADSHPQRKDYKIIKEYDVTNLDWSKYEPVFG
jgi:sulfite oxidase